MKRGLLAAYGVARNEVVHMAKTRMLVIGVVLVVLFTIFLGYLMGLQSREMKGLRVGLYQELGVAPEDLLKGSQLLRVTRFDSYDALVSSIKADDNLAGLVVKRDAGAGLPGTAAAPKLKVVIDDTKGAVARMAQGYILRALMSLGGPTASLSSGQLETETVWGLDMAAESYPIKILGPGLLLITAVYSGLMLCGFMLIQERTGKTLSELALAPVNRFWIVLGKLVGSAVVLVLQMAAVTLVVVYLFGVPIKGSLVALFATALLAGLGFVGLAFTLSSLARDERTFRLIAGLPIVWPVMLLSGIMYPIEGFPDFLQKASAVMPASWATEAVRDVFFKGASFVDVAPTIGALALVAAALTLTGTYMTGRMMARGE